MKTLAQCIYMCILLISSKETREIKTSPCNPTSIYILAHSWQCSPSLVHQTIYFLHPEFINHGLQSSLEKNLAMQMKTMFPTLFKLSIFFLHVIFHKIYLMLKSLKQTNLKTITLFLARSKQDKSQNTSFLSTFIVSLAEIR